MGIEFLKVTPEQAVEEILDCARKGYATTHAMQIEHDGVGGPAGVTDEMVTEWIHKINSWTEETRKILLGLYSSPNYMYRFLEVKPNIISSGNEEQRFSNIKHGLLERVKTLNEYVDFIIQNSSATFSVQNNLTYLHLNPERDMNVAGRDVKTEK